MENCWEDLCKNNSTCDDRGGYFYCFCSGMYYGEVCEDCKYKVYRGSNMDPHVLLDLLNTLNERICQA